MPSDTDKQNDNLEQASKSDKKFIAFKKCMFRSGVVPLIAAIALSLLNYFACEKGDNVVGAVIFLFVVAADILILLPAIITKETSWPALLGSTILCIVFLCLSLFYPFQHFQYRLKVISLVAIVATLLFVLLNNWINAAFFPSKNADIHQSVDFASNRFAVDVLNVTLILGTLFGTIAFLYFYPGGDNSTFFGGIDIKNVALATAGLVTFFWAAKATKNKSIELEEKKQDGKRHDNEIAMAKRRDTAQLIAEASKLLSSENDAQKYAGLSFLNAVASDPEGPLREEAFDLIANFITSARDVTITNKVRMRAIHYVDDLVGNNSDNFEINEFILISSSGAEGDYSTSIEIENLYAVYINLDFEYEFIQRVVQSKFPYQFGFLNCTFHGENYEDKIMPIIRNITAFKCEFMYCKIEFISSSISIFDKKMLNGSSVIMRVLPKKYYSLGMDIGNTFKGCDFSNCLTWENDRASALQGKNILYKCFYYWGYEPKGFEKKTDDILITEIIMEEQFEELFKDLWFMEYSPPDERK